MPKRSTQQGRSDAPSPEGLGSRKWLVLAAVGVGSFMSALDASIVNTLLPVMSRAFRSSVASVEWIVTIYLLIVSGLLLLFGRLGDLHGHKSVYVNGFGVFVVGSALSGLAPAVHWLVGFRGLQGIGAAMLFANSPAILTLNFPSQQRGRALGLYATMTYLGLTVGPSLGGWLAQNFTWRAVFYLNVPIGMLALYLSYRFIPQRPPEERKKRFDWAGATTFTFGLSILLLALNQGGKWGWASLVSLGSFALAIAMLGSFVALERHHPAPMLDLGLFRNRVFTMSTASALLNYMAVYGVLFLLPFYFIQGRGMSPEHAGFLLTAQPITMAVVAPLSGALSDRIGARIPATVGMGILAAGLFLLSRLEPVTSEGSAVIALAVIGLGTGIFISPNSSALMGAAPPEGQGIAGGILAMARNVGMVVGVGLAGAIFSTLLGARGLHSPLAQLTHAVDSGLLMTAGVALLGALTSLIR